MEEISRVCWGCEVQWWHINDGTHDSRTQSMKSAFHSMRIVSVEQWLRAPLRVGEGWERRTHQAAAGWAAFQVFRAADDPVGFHGVCGSKISPWGNNSHCFSGLLTARLTTAGFPRSCFWILLRQPDGNCDVLKREVLKKTKKLRFSVHIKATLEKPVADTHNTKCALKLQSKMFYGNRLE